MRKIFLCISLFLALGFTNKAVGQFDGGNGSATEPFLISKPEQLVELISYLGNKDMHFKLNDNIDLTSYLAAGGAGHNSGAGWMPIGNYGNSFSGKFDGAGFKITGLWIDRSSTDYVGLFGNVDGMISNLGVEIAPIGINGRDNVGGLIGYYNSTSPINDCYVTGNVSGGSTYSNANYVGGLIGANRGVITNCYFIGNVTTTAANTYGSYIYVGGLIGTNSGTITKCYVIGNVSGNTYTHYNNFFGGLLGNNEGTINNCYVIGNVSSNNIYNDEYGYENGVGGLIGSTGGTVTNCYVTGNVSGSGYNISIGGLIGKNRNTGAVSNCYVAGGNISGDANANGGSIHVGGLIGANNSSATNCYANADVSSNGRNSDNHHPQNSNHVGGLIGTNSSTVDKCYATGNVTGNGDSYSTSAGGLIGNHSGVAVTTCYATGNVIGIGNGTINSVGGLLGRSSAACSNCYAIGEVSCSSSNRTYSVGGLIGSLSSSTISNCYASGKVSGNDNDNVGGFIGSNYGTINNSFFDKQTTEQVYAVGSGYGTAVNLLGKSTAEMKIKSTFTSLDWDFETVWNIVEGESYPYFIDTYNFPANGGNITVPVSYNQTWNVSSNATWLIISPSSGSGNGSFTMTASANTASSSRMATITVSHGRVVIRTIDVTQDGAVSIFEKAENNQLQIFPNPANNEISIKSELQIEKLEIYSMTGILLQSENNFKGKISVSNLAQGVYFLKVYTDKGMVVSKFIKE